MLQAVKRNHQDCGEVKDLAALSRGQVDHS